MCGIIGYIGKENALPILLEGLRRESYRGYDSSGIVVFDGAVTHYVRAVGKLEKLEEMVAQSPFSGTIGIGHCLPPATLIQLADGRVKQISNIVEGEEVLSLDFEKLTLTKGKVRISKHTSPIYLYEIRTPSTVFEATGQHKMFVWTEKGVCEKPAKDIVLGDIMTVPKLLRRSESGKKMHFEKVPAHTYYKVAQEINTLFRNRIESLGLSRSQLVFKTGITRHDLDHMITNDRNVRTDVLERILPVFSIEFPSQGFLPQHSIHGNFVKLPSESSSELMKIIGYFLGDCYAGERGLRFKDMRKDVLETYQLLFKNVFNLSGKIGTMNDTAAYILEINSSALSAWFKKNISTRKEQLLEEVGQLPLQELAAFLRGLFDAEGFVGMKGHQVGLGMTNEIIVKSLRLFLLQFGILASVSDSNTNRPAHWKRPYRIAISSHDSIERFLSAIGFSSLEKRLKIERLLGEMVKQSSISFKILPYSKKALHKKCASFVPTSILRKFLGHGSELNKFIREGTLRNLLVYLEKETSKQKKAALLIKEIKTFLYGEVIFQEVTATQKKKSEYKYLYDLEVTPQMNFFANGVLSHNSRWATHGGVTQENAHPHTDCKDNFFLVHNGIIENYAILRDKLEKEGHRFTSQTDTEVLPHLIEHFFKGNLEQAVREALRRVRGAYGIAVIAKQDPGKIVVAKLSSPLVLSVNGAGGFVASDPAALLSHSNKMVFLDDREIGVITLDHFSVTDLQDHLRVKETTELDWTLEEAEKGGYPHFLLKEIMEQPESLANALRGRLLADEGMVKLGGLDAAKEKLREIEKVQLLACGSASYASRVGEYMLEEYAGIPAETDIASEFRYRKPVFDKKTLSIFVSQSGETADTLAALHEVKEKGGLSLGVVNVVGSSVARAVDMGIYTHAGAEVSVGSTKAFTAQIAAMALIAVYLGRQRQLSLVMGQRIVKELARIPDLVRQVLQQENQVQKIAGKYQQFSNFFLIGRKYNNPIALEGALKLKEIAYIHAEGTGGGELKHGSLALIDESVPTIAIVPSDSVYEKMISAIQEIKARNGKIIAIATQGNEDIKNIADDVIYIPKTLEMLTPILTTIPIQLLAYYIGVLKGNDVDKPRNLAKSVTVE